MWVAGGVKDDRVYSQPPLPAFRLSRVAHAKLLLSLNTQILAVDLSTHYPLVRRSRPDVDGRGTERVVDVVSFLCSHPITMSKSQKSQYYLNKVHFTSDLD